jgi:cell division transport system permease protein
MRLEYYFRETAAGIRRNGMVAFAAMSTSFIALLLFGIALLIWREFNLVTNAITGNVQVAVYLTDPVKPDVLQHLQTKLEALPAVGSGNVTYEDHAATCARAKEIFQGQQAFQNIDCKTLPTSLRVKLNDTSRFDEITAAMACAPDPNQQNNTVCVEPGVKSVSDFTSFLDRMTTIRHYLSIGIGLLSFVMLLSAIALVANTLRMGMFARRREISVMRLVGATNWRIRVPFLVEGLVEALIGAVGAILILFALKVFFIDHLRGQIGFFPLIRNGDVLAIMPWILVIAVVVAVIAGTIGMRRFLDV